MNPSDNALTRDKITVLDHGYVQYIEHWGSDERIIESARMSTNKGFIGWGPWSRFDCNNESCVGYSWSGLLTENELIEQMKSDRCPKCHNVLTAHKENRKQGDEKLLRYLYEHKHSTPFEMAGLTLEIQAPIFVFREWHRHRTQSYSELSARYTPLPDVNYIPTVERLMMSGGNNKQAQGLKTLISENAQLFREWLEDIYTDAENIYKNSLNMGVPKELARLCLPVARYSRMRASANLRNWLLFLTLRMDNNAQWEIRQFANTVGDIVSKLYPRTWELFIEGFRGEVIKNEQ